MFKNTDKHKGTNEMKSLVICQVPGCRKKSTENQNITFHRFPTPKTNFIYQINKFGNEEKIDKYDLWKQSLNINIVTSSTRVCTLHFKREDFLMPGKRTGYVI